MTEPNHQTKDGCNEWTLISPNGHLTMTFQLDDDDVMMMYNLGDKTTISKATFSIEGGRRRWKSLIDAGWKVMNRS